MPAPQSQTQPITTPPARKPRKSRGRGLRTTTGCKICRQRHMKCDEVKPICGPCAKGDRPCEYDASATPPVVERNSTTGTRPEKAPRRAPSVSSTDSYPWPRQETRLANGQIDQENYATEKAPLRWFGLLNTDVNDVQLNVPPQDEPSGCGQAMLPPGRPDVMQVSTIAPCSGENDALERASWERQEPIQLQGLEFDLYSHFVLISSAWLEVYDPDQHFAIVAPRLALRNEGLMKAMLALAARHLITRSPHGKGDALIFHHAAVQYYSETLQYLQSAMRYDSYKNSPELLTTTLIISAYEMLDGAGSGWDRHLKGVFWIQRTRKISGENGNGLEQAVWWAWLHQDVWAALRERRKCFSSFTPTKPYSQMSNWEIGSRAVYLLSQAVNFVSEEERRETESNPSARAARADELSHVLEEWYANKGIAFDPLPVSETRSQPFKALWIHPQQFANSVQVYHVARSLVVANRPPTSRYRYYSEPEKIIAESVDVIAGLATYLKEGWSRALSTYALFTGALVCTDPTRRSGILELLDGVALTDFPSKRNLPEELKAAWAQQDQAKLAPMS